MTEEQSKLVLDNINLVHYILKKDFHKISYEGNYYPTATNEYEDLFQEGCYALCLAATRFDESKGYKFSTFAYPYVKFKILRYKRECDCRISIGKTDLDLLGKIKSTSLKLGLDLFDNQDIDTILDFLEITEHKDRRIAYKLVESQGLMSIDQEVKVKDNSKNSRAIEEIIPCEMFDYDDIEFMQAIDNAMEYCRLNGGKEGYKVYEEYIYTLIYGNEKLRQKELSTKYNLSQPYISRIIIKYNKLMFKYLDKYCK